jgi:hypothetical protein
VTDPTREQLIQAVARMHSPTRRQVRTHAAVSYSVAIAWMCGVFAIVNTLAHNATRPTLLTAALSLGLCVLAATATAAVLARGASPVGRSPITLAAITGLVPFAVLGWLAIFQPTEAPASVPAGWRCHAFTLVLGAALLLAMAIANRRSDPIHATWLGAAFGAVAGAWAAVFVAAWCPLFDVPHVLLGHVAPILVLAASGMLLASRALR